jgi:peptide/nickel transport system permease protein
MLLVSVLLFLMIEVGGGDISIKILGIFSTEEQRASFRAQLGLDRPAWLRYLDWLVGNDWRVKSKVDFPLRQLKNEETGELEWWAEVDGKMLRWQLSQGRLQALVRNPDGATSTQMDDNRWQTNSQGEQEFWGLDNKNRVVKWVKGAGKETWVVSGAGILVKTGDGPQQFIPLRKGLLRGDAGHSLQYGRPVSSILWPRLRNTAVLAALAFVFIMPLALLLGVLAGINEGKLLDRIITLSGLAATATPEFVSGVFLILVFGIWLQIVPPVAVFTTDNAFLENPALLVLPLLTLTLMEVGYVARMTRASFVEVMDSAYIRAAVAKGMPYWWIVLHHAVRNALMAPVTIIMLHLNWLIGGLVVVEIIFGYPGLGKFIYDAALFGDFSAVEAAAMVTVGIAVATRLLGDLAYLLLNPRIRYA